MRKCKHIRIFFEHRPEEKPVMDGDTLVNPYWFHTIKGSCACGKVDTNWKQDEYQVRVCFDQIRRDLHQRGKL